jgi:cell division transport system permease protein
LSAGIVYSILEGFRGLKRAKFSASVSIFTIFLTLVLITILLIFIVNVHRIVNQIQARLELEIFVDNSFAAAQINSLLERIKNVEGIEAVRFVSKEEAADFVKQQFGQDVFEILDENPLPASFQIKLLPAFRSAKTVKIVIDKLLKLEGIDDILYRHDLLVLMEKYMKIFLIIMIIVGSVLAAGSVILVSNTIKLIIFSRRSIIEIMKLVGATRGFIRRPFIVEGIVQGTAGGLLASLLFYLLFKIIKIEIPGMLLIDQRIHLILLLLGFLFGLLGSIFALRKFLKY